ncbi:hypothetical protein RCL1_005520 [Eukaryota sp. TZLM3-RCL]
MSNISSEPFDVVTRASILYHLLYFGHSQTALAFSKQIGFSQITTHIDVDRIHHRRTVYQFISQGNIVEALLLLDDLSPNFQELHPELAFKLHCQSHIERLRSFPDTWSEILGELGPCLNLLKGDLDSSNVLEDPNAAELAEIALLMLCESTETMSKLGIDHLMSPSRRESLATLVNEVLLSNEPWASPHKGNVLCLKRCLQHQMLVEQMYSS